MNKIFFYLHQLLLKIKSFLPENDNLDWLDGFAFIISAWLIICPYPSYTSLFCILAFIPVLGITLTVLKGNAHFDHYIKKAFNKNGVEQNIVSAYILTSTLTIALSVFLNFECENYYSLLTHGAIAFAIFAVIFIFIHRNIRGSLKHQTVIYVLLGVCILLYSYGITYGVNCLFDPSKPERFETKIIGKHINHHRKSPDTYYVSITPWGHHHDSENITVSYDLYNRLIEGDLVDIDLQQGLFDIPWYYLNDSTNISDTW